MNYFIPKSQKININLHLQFSPFPALHVNVLGHFKNIISSNKSENNWLTQDSNKSIINAIVSMGL